MNATWLAVIIIIALPFLAYVIGKFGGYGYHKGKRMAERKEVNPTTSDNK